MQSEDILILGVAGVIAANRGFSGTGLRDSNAAYVLIQAINVGVCFGLFFFRIEGFPAHLDSWVRIFLTLFVGWQMVNNNRVRVVLARQRFEEELRQRQRARTLEAIHAEDADVDLAPPPESLED
jgi:hypothetical protein